MHYHLQIQGISESRNLFQLLEKSFLWMLNPRDFCRSQISYFVFT